MAVFQTLNNVALPPAITLYVGNVLKFKLIPGRGELVPFALVLSQPKLVTKQSEDVRQTANFQIYTIRAESPGNCLMSATGGKAGSAGPISLTVSPRLALPPADTAAGALTRLLLAEAPSPFIEGYTVAGNRTGMHRMRLVIENRLAMKSHRVASAGARNLIDVIRAPGQFKGFGDYPAIADAQANNIQAILDVANDAANSMQPAFLAHVMAAIEVPGEKLMTDPCPTKLVGWRTAGASGPGSGFKLFDTFAGQDFYTLAP